MRDWYLKKGGRQAGAFQLSELIQLYQKGDLTKETLVWVYQKNGWGWVEAEDVIELRNIFFGKGKKSKEGLFEEEKETGDSQPLPPLSPPFSKDKIWAIAGGKGGVGKSLVASSLAIGLTILGKKVVIVDFDFGGANIHTMLGIDEPKETLYDFLLGHVASLENIVVKTQVEGLFFISGKGGAPDNYDLVVSNKNRLLEGIKKIDCDYLILDLGAGTTHNQLDFFIHADQGIVVTTPEPPAIQDAFYFVKMALSRKVEQSPTLMNSFFPKIILNQVREFSERKDGTFILQSIKKLLNIKVDLLGYIYFDWEVRKAAQHLKPLLVYNPKSKAATCFFTIIVHRLLNKHYLSAKFEERGLRKKVQKIKYAVTYPGYRSGIGIYK